MNDLHTTPSFKALDEGRLQPVDKGDVVTQEARKAAADLLDEVSSLLGDTGIGQVAVLIRDGKYDEHDATLAFARFERDILARSRSEVGCTVPGNHPLAKGLRTSQKALDEIKRQEQANIAGYLAMRDMPIGSVAADARHQSETGAALTSDGGREVDYMDIAAAFGPVLKDGFPKASPMFRMTVAEALADEVRKREHWFRSAKPPTTKPHDDLIEQAVRAVLDAGLAENGEQGVGAARHAARFICEQREYWREYERAQLADEIEQIKAARSLAQPVEAGEDET